MLEITIDYNRDVIRFDGITFKVKNIVEMEKVLLELLNTINDKGVCAVHGNNAELCLRISRINEDMEVTLEEY